MPPADDFYEKRSFRNSPREIRRETSSVALSAGSQT